MTQVFYKNILEQSNAECIVHVYIMAPYMQDIMH